MERVKVFFSQNCDSKKLEKDINEWLESMGETLEITRALQAASGRIDQKVVVTIFYKKI